MNISKINNTSFGAIMIERGHKTYFQRSAMRDILMCPELDEKLIQDLEKVDTDVYVSVDGNGRNIDLRLRTAGGLTYNFVPKDSYGHRIISKISKYNNIARIHESVANFASRARSYIYSDAYNIDNMTARKNLEKLSEKDMMGKYPYRISNPDNLRDASCYFGTPQVTTKDFLRKDI